MYSKILVFSLLTLTSFVQAQDLAQATRPPAPQAVSQKASPLYFAGQINDLYNINVSLDCQHSKCTGTLTYVESGTNFKLEGKQQGNTILLQEIDTQQAISGFIKAQWQDKHIQGEWSNIDGTIGSTLQLQQVAQPSTLLETPNEKWVKRYRGVILWDEVEMIIHHLGKEELSGTLYYRNQDEYKPITGIIDENKNFHISIKNGAGLEEGTLISNRGNYDNFRAEYTDSNGKRNHASFELKNDIPVGYIEYADYVTSYEILYPEYNNINFTNWVKTYLKDWTERCRSHVKAIKEHYPICEPQARASERAYVWFEIESIDKEWLVGQFFFSNTWSDQTVSKPINFNIQTGKPVEWDQLFKKRIPHFESFKKEYITHELRRNPRYMDNGFRDWIHRASFPIFTIQEHGIQFSTQYDEIYGQAKVTIPYDKLRRFMKPKTVVQNFF